MLYYRVKWHFYFLPSRLPPKIPNWDHVKSFSNKKANHSLHFPSCIFDLLWFSNCISTSVEVCIFTFTQQALEQCSLWLLGGISLCQMNWKSQIFRVNERALKRPHEILKTFQTSTFHAFSFGKWFRQCANPKGLWRDHSCSMCWFVLCRHKRNVLYLGQNLN